MRDTADSDVAFCTWESIGCSGIVGINIGDGTGGCGTDSGAVDTDIGGGTGGCDDDGGVLDTDIGDGTGGCGDDAEVTDTDTGDGTGGCGDDAEVTDTDIGEDSDDCSEVGIRDRVAGDCDVCSSVAGIDGSDGITDVNVGEGNGSSSVVKRCDEIGFCKYIGPSVYCIFILGIINHTLMTIVHCKASYCYIDT